MGIVFFRLLRFHPVIQKSIVTDFLKSWWEYMHQKTPDKFGVRNRNLTFGGIGFYATCWESSFRLCHGKNSAVWNGNLMCIAPEILNCIAKAVESFFYERTPVFFIKFVFEIFSFVWITEFFAGRRKCKLFVLIVIIQKMKIFPLKLISENFNRNKKVTFWYLKLFCFGKTAAWNDTVHTM